MNEFKTMTVEIDRNGELIPVEIEGLIHYYVVPDYGADADGNRRVAKVVITGVSNFDCYANSQHIELEPKEQEHSEGKLVEKFLEDL